VSKFLKLTLILSVLFTLSSKAQKPNITYSSPQTVYLNKPVIPIKVTSNGGAVPNAVFPTVAKFLTTEAAVSRFVRLPSGDIYGTLYGSVVHIKPDGSYTTLAGGGQYGYADGTGSAAAFGELNGIAYDAAGNIYVSDINWRDGLNSRVRKITPAGLVSTYAGGFAGPNGLVVGADGVIYIAEGVGRITKIAKDGTKTLLAGQDAIGSSDGTGAKASFYAPTGVAIDKAGNLYVADSGNGLIRKISVAGVVTTVAGSKPGKSEDGNGRAASFNNPTEIQVDSKGGLIIGEAEDVIRKITRDGDVFTIKKPYLDEQGNLFYQGLTNRTFIDANDDIIGYNSSGFSSLGFFKINTTGYSVYPELPQGLKLGPDGSISGAASELTYKTRYNITASNASGVNIAGVDLEVVLSTDAPVITSFSPAKVIRGQQMSIHGRYFTGTTAITIGGKPSPYFQVEQNGNTINVYSPEDAVAGDITVTTPYGTARIAGFDIVPPPLITSISSLSGYQGSKITITGTGFTDVYQVYFGGYYSSYTVISPTQIEATLGSGASGDITISSAAGTGTFPGFTFIKAPAVTATIPASAGAGATVTIKGTDFANATSVKFGTVEAKSFKVDAANQITAVIAGGSSSSITITTPAGTSTYDGFTFVPVPTVFQVTPLKGGANTSVTIYGTGLTNAQVTIGGVAANVTYSSNYQLSATVGSGAASGDVVVTTAGGTISVKGFIFVLPPTITSFSPQTAGIGDKVIITGTEFTEADFVQFGGIYAPFKVISPTSIEATVANGSSGSVTVNTKGGVASLPGFTHKAPVINSFTPTTASNGGTVTISGVNFTGATSVTFGGTPAKSFSVTSATQINAVVGAGKSGSVIVTTPFGSAFKDGFEHPGPAITYVSPLYAGPLSAAPITIYGANFTGATSISFGSVAATSFTVTSPTTITVTPPAGASGDVVVMTPRGSDKAAGFVWVSPPAITGFVKNQNNTRTITVTGNNFIGVNTITVGGVACYFTVSSANSLIVYIDNAPTGDLQITTVGGSVKFPGYVNSSPAIQAVSPATAAVGQTITITGVNFNNVQSVKFGNVNATSYTVVSSGKIAAVVADGSSSPLIVTTADGTSYFSDFRLLQPPAVYYVSPDKGGLGTLVTISGTNLTNTTGVKIGGTSATIISVQDNSVQVKVTTGTTGAIVLTTPAGSATFGMFTWYPAPIITSGDPMRANASTTVTITGKNFDEISEVKFGDAFVQWTVVSPTQITAQPLYGASGDIKVTGAGGSASLSGFSFIAAPVISSFTKTGEGANSSVILTGANFNKVTEVKFGGVPARSFNVNSATSITAQPGNGATGFISVVAEGGTGSIRGYLYNSPPAITSFSPAYGPIGSTITITGNNFNTDVAKNAIFFGPVKATIKSVTKTSVQVTVPAAGNGFITVADIEKGLSASSNLSFNVTNNKGASVSFSNNLEVPFSGVFGGYSLDDFDGDGFADILVARNDSVYIRLHGSDPQLSKSSFSQKVVLITNRQMLSVTVGDIDGDGKKDILAAFTPSVVLLRNTSTDGNIQFEQKTLENVDGGEPLSLRDMDMDGRPDLIANPYYGVCYPNTTTGSDISFGNAVLINSSSGGATMSLAIADVDGDGKPEPIRSSSYGVSEVYKNNTVPGDLNANDFAPSYINYSGGFQSPDDLLPADIDGDGKTDLVGYSTGNSYLLVSKNVSTGTINGASFAIPLRFQSNFMPYYMSAADMDGDGKTDLIGASNYDVSFMRNQTSGGSISMAAPVVLVPASTQYVALVRPLDMDGDGRMDVVVVRPERSSLIIYHSGPVVTPKIAAVTPLLASAGSKITITGKHFDAATVVKFGNKEAQSFKVISHQKIEAILGDGESGLVSVKTPNGTATFAGFAVVDGPVITSAVAATDGSGLLVITGSKLTTTKDVEIAGIKALSFFVESDTRITATFAAIKGMLAVTTNTGTATLDNVTVRGIALITFNAITSQTYGNSDINLSATSTNTKTPINYSFDKPNIIEIKAGKIHILNAGTVIIMASQTGDDLFGTPASIKQTLVINKKELQVKADDQTRSYGKPNPALIISYNGFVNGDDKTKLAAQPVAGTTANAQSLVGVYDISVSGGASVNYSFAYASGTLTVNPSASNLKVASNSVTCKGQNNGAITINASQTANYTAAVSGPAFNKTYNFTNIANIENLPAGTYNLCVADDALPDFKQCFDIVIAEPRDLSVYTAVNKVLNNVELALSGGNTYEIRLNDVVYKTSNGSITLPLNYGSNRLSVRTDKNCQGIIERIINLSGNTTPYPNPFRDVLHINIGLKTVAKTIINIYDVQYGRLVLHKEFTNESGVLNLDVSGLQESVYSLHLTIDNKSTVYKIFNK
jgi:hypothetical protein